jgi:group I intron endonuclease
MIIYKITNIINGKSYVGQTKYSLDERWQMHLSDMIKKTDNNYFHNAIHKYGIEKFNKEILYESNDFLIINLMETFKIMVNHSHKSEGGYNLTWGGEDNPMNHQDIKEKMTKSIKDLWAIPENHKRFSNAMKGKRVNPFTNEHKEKMSKSKMGNKNPNYGKQMTITTLEKRSKNTYMIQYPDKHIEYIKVLSYWCKEHNINYNSLLFYISHNKQYKGYVVHKI